MQAVLKTFFDHSHKIYLKRMACNVSLPPASEDLILIKFHTTTHSNYQWSMREVSFLSQQAFVFFAGRKPYQSCLCLDAKGFQLHCARIAALWSSRLNLMHFAPERCTLNSLHDLYQLHKHLEYKPTHSKNTLITIQNSHRAVFYGLFFDRKSKLPDTEDIIGNANTGFRGK